MENKHFDYDNLRWKVIVAIISHPMRQGRILMRLGYEPGDIKYGKDWGYFGLFRKEKVYRAGLFGGYLTEAGIFQNGLPTKNVTTGMTMAICEAVSGSITQTAVTEFVNQQLPLEKNAESYSNVLTDIVRQIIIKSAETVVTRPFLVVAIRQIATIAGDKNVSFIDISKDLFAGMIPKLLFEASNIFIGNTLIYMYKKTTEEIKDESSETSLHISHVIKYATNTFLYPLLLISQIQALSGTGFILDEFPELSVLQIYSQLRSCNQLDRGYWTFFWRNQKRDECRTSVKSNS